MNDNQQNQMELTLMSDTGAEILYPAPKTIAEYVRGRRYIHTKIDGELTTAYRTQIIRYLALLTSGFIELTPYAKQVGLEILMSNPEFVPEVRLLKPEILEN